MDLVPTAPVDPPPPPWPKWTLLADRRAWPPVVAVDAHAATVSFHTVSGRGGWRLLRHVDRYEDPSSYVFDTESKTVAKAPGGWVP